MPTTAANRDQMSAFGGGALEAAVAAHVRSPEFDLQVQQVLGRSLTYQDADTISTTAMDLAPKVLDPDLELDLVAGDVVRKALIRLQMGQRRGRTSPFLATLRTVPLMSRFCTPSIIPGHLGQFNLEQMETSISMAEFGSLTKDNEKFRATNEYLAELHTAAAAFVCVNGSSGANQEILHWISMNYAEPLLAIGRTAHKGIIEAAEAFGLPWKYIGQDAYDPEFEAFGPLDPKTLEDALKADPAITHVLFNSVTYEGIVADLAGLADVRDNVRADVVLIADEAWGAHLRFYERLNPIRAMSNRIDIANLSTHKQGGSLQGGALIVVGHEAVTSKRVDVDAFRRSVGAWASTSPNFTLFASVDQANRELEVRGEELIGQSVQFAERFVEQIQLLIGRSLRTVAECLVVNERPRDPLKVTFALSDVGLNGFEVAEKLYAQSVVVETEGLNKVMFLFPFQLRPFDVQRAIETTAALLAKYYRPNQQKHPTNPATAIDRRPISRVERATAENVPLGDAVGRVAVDVSAAYPPGIPIIVPGMTIGQDHIEFLRATAAAGGSIAPSSDTLRVVR